MSHGHLHNAVHSSPALPHLHELQSPLHEHLINSRHDLDTSGVVIQIGLQASLTLVQPKPSGEGAI